MVASEILQLGHPTLRVKCSPVKKFAGPDLGKLVDDLRDTLNEFRARHGFGRGIAAPQIGSSVRVIFINVDRPMELINPVIVRRSRRMMTLWDDCFSFPTLVAKVRRNLAVEVRYQDIEGKHHTLKAEGALSELLQHEIDHIDGILAIDRAIDTKHIVYRTEYDTQAAKRESVVL
jgi:peptide deformylase